MTKDGQRLFGAHVVAFDAATRRPRSAASRSSDDGRVLDRRPVAGPHVLRVEPLDDADIDSFFDTSRTVDLDFRVAFSDRLVVVPRGGDSGEIGVKVARK